MLRARLGTIALSLAWIIGPPAQELAVSTAARSLQPGELVVVTVRPPVPATAVRVTAFDRTTFGYPSGDDTWQALIGIDLDVKPGTYRMTAEAVNGASRLRATRDLAVKAKAFPTRRLTVDPDFVNPPPEAQERIAREAAELERVWASASPERLWRGAFERPVPHEANSAFGTRSVFNGQPRSPHGGADFLSPGGTPVLAPNAGRIALARDRYYTGNTVVVDHGLGLFSLFAHLSEIAVAENARVSIGQVVGKVGATGRVTGAHLHWTVRLNGTRIDPLSLIEIGSRHFNK